jgi:4-amino-4-deoxychorismate lyase
MDSLINGIAADSISIYDRGLAYGDGLFETMAVKAGDPLLFTEHMARLLHGCRILGIAGPDIGHCRNEVMQLCAGRTGVLKLILTRGSGGRGYATQTGIQPNRLLLFSNWHSWPREFYTQGIRIGISNTRIPEQPQLAGIKHLNRLENVLAAREVDGNTMQEGIMLDYSDRIIECTRSNIFFVKDGELHTPALDRCGVNGVMRNYILKRALEHGIKVNIRDIFLDEARQMKEAFVCNSLIGIWPVAALGDKISYQPVMCATVQGWTTECTLGFGPAHE